MGGCNVDRFWVPFAWAVGIVLGFALPLPAGHARQPWGRVSVVIGWLYFCAWSVSFWPQAWLNYTTKSVKGLSLDYQLLNLVGFLCYFLYNAAFFWSDPVRDEYAQCHGGNQNAAALNDVVFALHALVLTAFTLAQFGLYYERPVSVKRSARVLRIAVITGITVMALVAAGFATIVYVHMRGHDGSPKNASGSNSWSGRPRTPVASQTGSGGGCPLLSWLSVVYLLSFFKIGITFVKYLPQVWLNYERKSTSGWNIYNVLLDCTGGLLSIAQLVLDCWSKGDWSGIVGDPAKFMLGFLSLIFDAIFMWQHYVLYRVPVRPSPRSGNTRAAPRQETEFLINQ